MRRRDNKIYSVQPILLNIRVYYDILQCSPQGVKASGRGTPYPRFTHCMVHLAHCAVHLTHCAVHLHALRPN